MSKAAQLRLLVVVGALFCILSTTFQCLVSFVPEFLVADYASITNCQVAKVGAFTSEWTPKCASDVAMASLLSATGTNPAIAIMFDGLLPEITNFTSNTIDFWPIAPLQIGKKNNNILTNLLPNETFQSCERSLSVIHATAFEKVSDLVVQVGAAMNASQDPFKALFDSSIKPLFVEFVSPELLAAHMVRYKAESIGETFFDRLKYRTIVSAVMSTLAPCFCTREVSDEVFTQAVSDANLLLPGTNQCPTGVLATKTEYHREFNEAMAAGSIDARYLEKGVDVEQLSWDLELCMKVALRTPVNTFLNYALLMLTIEGSQGIMQACEDDNINLVRLAETQRLLIASIVTSGLASIVLVAAVIISVRSHKGDIKRLLEVGALLVLASGVSVVVALLAVKSSPMYMNSSTEDCTTCFFAGRAGMFVLPAIVFPFVGSWWLGFVLVHMKRKRSVPVPVIDDNIVESAENIIDMGELGSGLNGDGNLSAKVDVELA